MANRIIKSRLPRSLRQLSDCLTALFAMELAAPTGRLYLISPRIGDVVILSSPAGQFRALMPDLGRTELRLSEVLATLAARGSQVRLLTGTDDPATMMFLSTLEPQVAWRTIPHLEERGIVGERFYLRGSLELTHEHVRMGEESIELTTDPAYVAHALLDAEQLWGRGAS